jgi:hypothetical protein
VYRRRRKGHFVVVGRRVGVKEEVKGENGKTTAKRDQLSIPSPEPFQTRKRHPGWIAETVQDVRSSPMLPQDKEKKAGQKPVPTSYSISIRFVSIRRVVFRFCSV